MYPSDGCRWVRTTRGAHYSSPHNTSSRYPWTSIKIKGDKWAIPLPVLSHISPSRSRKGINIKSCGASPAISVIPFAKIITMNLWAYAGICGYSNREESAHAAAAGSPTFDYNIDLLRGPSTRWRWVWRWCLTCTRCRSRWWLRWQNPNGEWRVGTEFKKRRVYTFLRVNSRNI
jgi:hypothetical protein